MNMDKKNLLTPNEVTFILVGIILNTAMVSLPNRMVLIAKQDGWVLGLLGAVYPLYIALLAVYISNRFPKDNILTLSKRYLGKNIGTILNFLFLISFFSYLPTSTANISNILRTEAMPNLSPLKIYFIMLFLGAYAANKGIKVIGRICSIAFFILLMIILPSVMLIKEGSILNITPLFQTSIFKLLKGVESSFYDYSLVELIFLIYPFINDKSKIKASVFKAIGIITLIYTWVIFISIYYIGINIIPKTIWSYFTVTEGIKMEIVNNFRYVFIFFWLLISLKSTALLIFSTTFILEDIRKFKNKLIMYLILSAIVILITNTYYGDQWNTNKISSYSSTITSLYNLFYLTLVTFMVWIKKERI